MADNNKAGVLALIIIVAALAFAGGYYYYKEQDENTISIDLPGGNEISATVDN